MFNINLSLSIYILQVVEQVHYTPSDPFSGGIQNNIKQNKTTKAQYEICRRARMAERRSVEKVETKRKKQINKIKHLLTIYY